MLHAAPGDWDPLNWLRDHSGSVGAVTTAAWPRAVHGSGLVATADIARGELLLSVPAPLCLTALPGPSEGEDNLHEGHRLCLRLLGEHCRGPASQWHAWVTSLPTAFETPLHWPDLDVRLHGHPALLARAREERAHLAPMLEALDEEDQAICRLASTWPQPCSPA